MRLLFERNGLTNQPITLADISKAASDVAGHDLSAFFETYINKREALPISKTMQQLGLDLRGQSYAADMFLIEMPNATPRQLALRRSILGRWVTR
jgi:predicted metalloprotease with PDZ domain